MRNPCHRHTHRSSQRFNGMIDMRGLRQIDTCPIFCRTSRLIAVDGSGSMYKGKRIYTRGRFWILMLLGMKIREIQALLTQLTLYQLKKLPSPKCNTYLIFSTRFQGCLCQKEWDPDQCALFWECTCDVLVPVAHSQSQSLTCDVCQVTSLVGRPTTGCKSGIHFDQADSVHYVN